ncbi:MAG: hypothetical protein ACOC1O_00945 [bacterium]
MSNINQILNEQKELLLESGIKIPKGTKAAKIIFHNDTDGFFSALVTREQLIKQGIPLKNIRFHSIQYGASDKGLLNKFNVSKGQMAALVDFAGIEDSTMVQLKDKEGRDLKYKEGNKVEGEKGWTFEMKSGKVIAKKDNKSVSLKRYGKDGKYIPGEKITISAKLKAPDFWSDHHIAREEALAFIGKSKKTSGGINKTEYGSDTEHIARVNTVNMMTNTDIEAVTGVDSAKFDDLTDLIELRKNFKEKGRVKRLAIIVNSLLSQIIKRNPTAIKTMLRDKNTKPSVASVYNQTLKYSKLNNKQVEALEELGKENPNWEKIEEIRKQLPDAMKKETTKDVATKNRRTPYQDVSDEKNATRMRVKSREEMAEKGREDIKKATGKTWTDKDEEELKRLKAEKKAKKSSKNESVKYEILSRIDEKEEDELDKKIKELEAKKKESTSKFEPKGKVMYQNAKSTRDYPGRYTSSLIANKDGTRSPFVFKEFGGMLQVAVNPDIDDKSGIDLEADMREVLNKVEKKYRTRTNGWAWDKLKNESGGHKAITNVSGLFMLGLMPKKERTELKNLKELMNKSKLKTAEKRKKYPEKMARLKELEDMKKEAGEEREKIREEIRDEFIKLINEKYKDKKVTKPIKDQEKYVKNEAFIEKMKMLSGI